jgi:hypothetical protein
MLSIESAFRKFAGCQDSPHLSFARLRNLWEKPKMSRDPIVDEVRRSREEYAAKFNFDIDAMCDDLQKAQKKRGKRVVSLPPRPVEKVATKKTRKR